MMLYCTSLTYEITVLAGLTLKVLSHFSGERDYFPVQTHPPCMRTVIVKLAAGKWEVIFQLPNMVLLSPFRAENLPLPWLCIAYKKSSFHFPGRAGVGEKWYQLEVKYLCKYFFPEQSVFLKLSPHHRYNVWLSALSLLLVFLEESSSANGKDC